MTSPAPITTRAIDDQNVIVVIPLYKTQFSATEWASVARTLKVLANYPIAIVCPEHLAKHFANESAHWPHSSIRVQSFANHYFDGIAGYNQLLVSKAFYQAFRHYTFMLLVQTDALILSDQLQDWCERNYSYVGAPFFAGFAKPEQPLRLIGVGNGGISLRKIGDFLKTFDHLYFVPNTLAPRPSHWWDIAGIAKFIRHRLLFAFNIKPLIPKVNEDVFWGMLMARQAPFFTVPSAQEAIAFAFDNEPRYLYEQNSRQLPFACHAWERFDKAFWVEAFQRHGINLEPSNTTGQ